MKILEVNAYYNYGSTGRIVKDLCDEGTVYGYEMYAIHWLSGDKKNESDRIIYCGENVEPSRIKKITQWIFEGGKLNYNRERTKRIIDCIYSIKPNIIHLHNLHGDFEYGAIDIEMFFEALAQYGCRVIWTLHDCWPITGRCYYFSYKQCNRWKVGCGKCPQRFYDREGIFFDYSSDNWRKKDKIYKFVKNMTVVTVSHWLENVVKESILKNNKVVTIYNGIDTDTFKPDYKKHSNDRIMCIGWDRRKGYSKYFDIAKRMLDYKIFVIGERPFFRKIRKLTSNMYEIPFISDVKEMAMLYNEMSVYFNASVAETFGLTTAEALSCGLPVVGYNSTATPEIIGEKYGSIIRTNSIEDIVSALKKEISFDSDELRRNRHEYVSNEFNKKMMLKKYMNLYETENR